jgi:hypothetical protein
LAIPLLAPVFAVAILLHAGILQCLIAPEMAATGNLWRASVAILMSKTGESLPGGVILATSPWTMWDSDTVGATVVIPLLLFVVGVAVNATMIIGLYRAERPSAGRVLAAAVLLSTTSFVMLLVTAFVAGQMGSL